MVKEKRVVMSKVSTFFKLIKTPRKLIRVLGDYGFFNWLSDEKYLKLLFKAEFGYKLNINYPQTFNEKLQWLKLHDRQEIYKTYVDKFLVRDFIKNTLGEEYLIELIGVYTKVKDIPWESLPSQFVLKCTHGSKSNIVCQDKSKLNIKKSKKMLNKWMRKSWYPFGREWVYKGLEPKIICEKYISDKNTTPDDYKVLCFNGKAKLVEVHTDRYHNHKQDIYDIDFKKTDITQGNPSDIIIKKPILFDEMIKLSEVLAKHFYHIRVDWYIVKNKIYFGELTFFDGSGFAKFDNIKHDYLLGSYLDLPIEKYL